MTTRRPANPAAGFTLLEILISMAIFTVLGTMMVWFMTTSLNVFRDGMQASETMDRQDTILPRVRRDLANLAIPDDFDPPYDPGDLVVVDGRDPPPPPPPVAVRLRAGFVKLQRVNDPAFKNYPCPYIAFVMANAGEWTDPLKRRAGESIVKGADLEELSPETVRKGTPDSHYKPTGGQTEVCWIAVPQDAMDPPGKSGVSYPAVLNLYRGFRTPIGDKEKSLLDPTNLDEPREIQEACQLVAEGLIHFGAVWRRTFATDWEPEKGIGLGETAPYVGPLWDSTRALDSEWSLFRRKESLGDPSDDIFPAFVRLEATITPPSEFGHGRGEMQLLEDVGTGAAEIVVSDPDTLLQLDLGTERHVKVNGEWMQYRVTDVDYARRRVRVTRGVRGTLKAAHAAGSWVYVGMPSELEIKLPVSRDRTTVQKRRR